MMRLFKYSRPVSVIEKYTRIRLSSETDLLDSSINKSSLSLYIAIYRVLKERYDQYTIKYSKGYDESFLSENGAQCVMGSLLADSLGIAPGDVIMLLSYERMHILISMFEGQELDEQIKKGSGEFTVVGVITSEDPMIGTGIFAPLSKTAEIDEH